MLKCYKGLEKGANMFEKLEKIQIIFLSIVLTAGLIVASVIFTGALTKDQITVTGSAYRIVQSDSARLEIELMTREADKAQSHALAQKQIPIVKDYLKAKGITEENIELKAPNGYYSYKTLPNGHTSNEISRYNLSQNIVITSNDVFKIKEISTEISNLISKGIDLNVYPPAYFYSKLSDLKVQLLEDATKDAKQRAAAMLKATNNHVGKIQSVRAGVFQITSTDSTDVSDYGINDTTTIGKKVTSVANVVFRIK